MAESPPAQQRIGLHHTAFLRGYFEGLDVVELAQHYLQCGNDRRKVHRMRRWITDELVDAAKKNGDRVAARLLRLPPGAMTKNTGPALPTLELLRETYDPDGAFSEHELVEIFASSSAANATIRRAQRNVRLRARQRRLLEKLEATCVQTPSLHHFVADWHDASLAARLARVDLTTIEQLFAFMSEHGFRWYRRVPRIGVIAAERLLQWFDQHASSMSIEIPITLRLPRGRLPDHVRHLRAPDADNGIAPLERFQPVDALARADRDAIRAVLAALEGQATTYRTYRQHAERWLLWSVCVAGRPLTTMRAEDGRTYLDFTAAPVPHHEWCGPKSERTTAAWRPFEKGASVAGRKFAQRVLRSVAARLCERGHIPVNPFIFDAT